MSSWPTLLPFLAIIELIIIIMRFVTLCQLQVAGSAVPSPPCAALGAAQKLCIFYTILETTVPTRPYSAPFYPAQHIQLSVEIYRYRATWPKSSERAEWVFWGIEFRQCLWPGLGLGLGTGRGTWTRIGSGHTFVLYDNTFVANFSCTVVSSKREFNNSQRFPLTIPIQFLNTLIYIVS